MSWTDDARASSLAKVTKTCAVCKQCYQIARVAATRSRRCPECQARYQVERKKAIRVVKTRREYQKVTYHLVVDPDGTWGQDTYFAGIEMRQLLALSYLTVGTVFEVGGTKQVVAKDPDGGLKLEEV